MKNCSTKAENAISSGVPVRILKLSVREFNSFSIVSDVELAHCEEYEHKRSVLVTFMLRMLGRA